MCKKKWILTILFQLQFGKLSIDLEQQKLLLDLMYHSDWNQYMDFGDISCSIRYNEKTIGGYNPTKWQGN